MTSKHLWRVALATALVFACSVEAANAGPLVAALGTVFTAIGAAVHAIPLLGALISFGAQSLLAKMLAPDAPKQKGVKQKIDSGGDNPLSFIMGEFATAGKLVYVNQYTDDGGSINNKLALVVSLSEVPVSALSSFIWINGEKNTIDFAHASPTDPTDTDPYFNGDAPGPGFYRVNEYNKDDDDDYKRQYCWVKFYDGTQTVVDPYLAATFGADPDKPWTDDMIGRGCAYAIVVCRYSKKGIWSGIPEFKFVVKGVPLYDISKDSTMGGSGAQRWNTPSTWAWSDNPVVMKYNIIMGLRQSGDWFYGGQDTSQYQLPASYWLAAIAHCNETVHKASTDEDIKRYTAGCEVSIDQQPIDVIKELDKTCAGYTTEYGGVWKTWSGPPGTSVFSLTDDDIVITEEQTDELFKTDTYCGVRATYTKPEEGWVAKEFPPLIFDDFLTEDDGIQQIAELQLPFVTENNQAHRLMRLLVQDSRRQITHSLQLPPYAYILEPFDVLTWSSDRNGYDNKKFQVTAIDDLPNCNQQVMLREVNPSDYDWDTIYELPDPVGPLNPVKPGSLALDFTVAADQVDRPGGGKDKPAIAINWDWGLPDVDLKWVKWEVRRSVTQPKVIAHGTFFNTEDSTRTITSSAFRFKQSFQVRLFAQPERPWRGSSWTAWKDVTLVDIDVPGAPTLTRVSNLADDGNLDFYIDIDWTKVSADVKYDLKISDGTKTFYRHSGEENSFREPVTSGKTYTVSVRAVAEDGGTVGDWSTSANITVTKKNTAPTTPAGLALVADFHKLILSWTQSPDKDYAYTTVYRSSTNDFTAASVVHKKAGSGWTDDGLGNLVTRYYWITHTDRSGNESAKYPASNTAGVNGTTTAVTDSDTDGTGPATPTSLAVVQRTVLNGDGKVEIQLVASWTGIANKKATYVVRVDDGTDFDYYQVKDIGTGTATTHRKKLVAVSGVSYSVSVAAVSGTGVVGSYTSNVNITASKKSTAPTTPAGLTATGKFGRIVLRWTKSPDSDYRRTNVYASSTNDFTTATLIDDVTASKFEEGNLGNGATRYYWITHEDRSGNESAKYPTSNTAGISATTTTVADADTDATAPGAPTGVTLTQRTNIDEDGKSVLELKVVWTAPAGATARTSYEVNVSDGTDTWNIKATDLNARVPVRSNLLYTVKVRALAFNGTPGIYSTAATITPSKKATAPTTAAGLVANANHKRVRLDWTLCPDNDYKQTRIYRNTVNTFGTATIIGHVKGSTYVDDDVASNTTYFYWVAHIDNSGNIGTASSSATDTTPYILDADTDPTALGAPTGLALAQAAKDVDEDGKVDISITATWSALTGAKSYELEITEAGTLIDNLRAANLKKTFKAKSNKLYSVRIRALSFNGTPGAWSSAVTLTPAKKSASPTTASGLTAASRPKAIRLDWTASTEADFKWARVYRNTVNTAGTATSIGRTKADWFRDDASLVSGTTYFYWVAFIDTSDNEGSKSTVASVAYSGVTTADMEPGSVTDAITDQTAPSAPGAPTLTKRQVVDDDGTVNTKIKVTWSAVTGAKGYEVQVNDGTDTVYHKTKNLAFMINGAVVGKTYTVSVSAISFNGTASAFTNSTALTVTGKAAGNVPAPGTVTLTANKKRIKLDWVDVDDDTYPDYRITFVYRNTSNVTPTPGTTAPYKKTKAGYFIDDGVTTGTTYFYWIAHRDQSGNFGALSTVVSSASGGNEVSGFTDLTGSIAGGQIPGSIITDGMTTATIGTPSAPTVAQTNKDTNGDGTIDMGIKLSLGSLPSGAYAIVFKVDEYLSDNTTLVDTYYLHPRKLAAKYTGVIAGHYYRVSAAGVGFNNHEGSFSSVTTLQATGKTTAPTTPSTVVATAIYFGFAVGWDAITDADYAFTKISAKTTSGAPVDDQTVQVTTKNNYATVFSGGAGGSLYVHVAHVNTSGVSTGWVAIASTTVTPRKADVFVIGTNAVDTPQIKDDALTVAKAGATFFNDGNAAMAVGDIGSTAYCKNTTGSLITGGSTTAGSNLVYSDTSLSTGSSPSGTWRCMGRCPAGQATNWLRIS
jgi:hypothetical protein